MIWRRWRWPEYWCATPNIPTHIARGLYGLIVVEPTEGLSPVDKGFYVMQGEVFDEVHPQGADEAIHNVQTTLVPTGGATWVEFTVEVPGRYTLVDHALSRSMDKGAIAILEVEGPDSPEVCNWGVIPGNQSIPTMATTSN